MSRTNLEALAVADGVVFSVHSEPGDLIVAFKDWQERNWVITFKDVFAYENFGIEGVDLSHVEICAGMTSGRGPQPC